MAELPKSPLPPKPEYWEQLARRIREDAAGPLEAYAVAADVWYGVLARRAPWLVAASAAAMLILWLTLPPPGSSVRAGEIERLLAPTEMAGSLIGGPAPPSVDVLLVQFAPSFDEEGRR